MLIIIFFFKTNFYDRKPFKVGPLPNSSNVDNRGLITTLHRYNNCTTPPHMGVDSTHWAPPPCEGVLRNCCGGVVYPSFSLIILLKKNIVNRVWFLHFIRYNNRTTAPHMGVGFTHWAPPHVRGCCIIIVVVL
jgi:hypothetical protein